MSLVYSRRFVSPTLVTSAGHTKLFTVPVETVAVVRSVQVWAAAGASRVVLAIGTSAVVGNRFLNLSVAEFANLDLRLPLVAGEELWGVGSTAGGLYVTVSGFLFAE